MRNRRTYFVGTLNPNTWISKTTGVAFVKLEWPRYSDKDASVVTFQRNGSSYSKTADLMSARTNWVLIGPSLDAVPMLPCQRW